MTIKDFGGWDREIHSELEQIKRIVKAIDIKKKNIELSPFRERCVIVGTSGTYEVSLKKCDCVDFAMRGLPCKHIYRLAIEKGYISDLPKHTSETASLFDPEAEIQKYIDLYFKGAIKGDLFIQLVNSLGKTIKKK